MIVDLWLFWVILAGLLFVGEIFTMGFLLFWIGIGALLALAAELLGFDLIVQSSVFVITSAILLIYTKPLTQKFLRQNKQVSTNVSSLIGKQGIVTMEIDPLIGTGQVKVGGEIWSASSKNGEIIPKGSTIHIEEIIGVKAIVSLA